MIGSCPLILFDLQAQNKVATAIESKRAKEHDKPIIVYNCCDFYDNLFLQLDKMSDEKFTSIEDDGCYYVCSNVNDALKYLNNYYNKKDKSKKREK